MKQSIIRICVLAGTLIWVLLACAMLPAGFESVEEELIRHTISGMEFPPRVSGFSRINPVAYDKDGKDVSVGYQQYQPEKCIITFYIYPATGGLEEHAEELKEMIESHHEDAVLMSESQTVHNHAGVAYPGILLVYTYAEIESKNVLLGIAYYEVPVESRMYLFIYKDWNMMYRITYRQEFSGDVDIYISSFLERLVWP
jgi:hypothetical protein